MGHLGSRLLPWRETETANPERHDEEAGPSQASGSRKRAQSPGVFSPSYGKRMKVISKYAYHTLFLNGEGSDIKVQALGKVWCLHKTFLCQSAYFAGIIGGLSEDSHDGIIDLEISDDNVDVHSLHFVLGSLYRHDEVSVEPLDVPRVLAAAKLLQVEDSIQQCAKTMRETINVKTVCGYYVAAERYGLDLVKSCCFEWLLHNLMVHPSVELYKEIDLELMNLLISSSNLLVMQKEMDVYTTLKEWMFLRFNLAWKGSMRQLLVSANIWLSRHTKQAGNITFLETNEGMIFQPVFKSLRFQHIICDLTATAVIEQDNVIPPEWLSCVYKQQWLTLLRAQQCTAIWPRCINATELERYSMRCGKRIIKAGRFSWKWSGYTFGLPLHVIFSSHYILFKQNTFGQKCEGPACTQFLRNIVCRLTLVCFDSCGKICFSKTTGYKILTFKNDEEQVIMRLDGVVLNFPLYIFCNFLFLPLENTGN
ncbi:germ cell-less protein-like 2 [Ochotona curzoniae]|uniref:germ cell-less protein-like 2 n=1 Tax=Ochotona curzoniae TaxID=130825 RepID=UPI001B346521|nr:germ cell-less protein-like 2 [Ochotona curzoniae]XP_040858572.1 germ cell-less protein-like 2 [Ochotona curzoniae]